MRPQQQQQQVSVCQQSTASLSRTRGAFGHSIRLQSPLPSSQSPHISQSWLKSKADVSSLLTCTIARQRQAPCPTTNGQYVYRPTSLRVPCCCLCQSVTLCISNSNIMESQWSGYCSCCYDVFQVFTRTDYVHRVELFWFELRIGQT